MRKDFLVFGSPRIEEDEISEVVDSLRSGWISTGPKVGRFEALFREYTGARHALALCWRAGASASPPRSSAKAPSRREPR